MDVQRILAELTAQRPGSPIKQNAPDGKNVTELVREDPSSSLGSSTAVAVIERSARHHHIRMTEVYRVLRGELTLHVNRDTVVLKEHDEFTIRPGVIHWGESDPESPAWIEVVCTPAFSPEDLIPDP
jgi:mannose-6-phosphate isomerase-like protein (cupin superfamily)